MSLPRFLSCQRRLPSGTAQIWPCARVGRRRTSTAPAGHESARWRLPGQDIRLSGRAPDTLATATLAGMCLGYRPALELYGPDWLIG